MITKPLPCCIRITRAYASSLFFLTTISNSRKRSEFYVFFEFTPKKSLIRSLFSFNDWFSLLWWGQQPPTETQGENTPTPSSQGGSTVSLVGAGASFPAPLYQRWFSEYNKVNPNVQVSYQSVGSGAGVEQFTQQTVDFGASDVAMADEEMAAIAKGVVLLPMTAGSIVLAYNLPGVEELKLSRQVYVDILLGKITKWNDPALVALNPDATLPDQDITVIYRSDGSGTTGVFTKHLTAVSQEWADKVGEGKTVQWPVGIGAKGNEGVTAQIQQTQGAIGYIEYGYAKQQNIPHATIENKAGQYVKASSETASATLAAVELPENLRAFISDPEGENSYPIVSYTWIMAYKQYDDANKSQALKEVLTWALNDGQSLAPELGYIPLPDTVVERVEQAVESIQ
jgi:phosphate transport system substrate-binding protein